MIYDIVITAALKRGKFYREESSIEAPHLEAAIVFAVDGLCEGSYEPHTEGYDEGKITINAKVAINNIPAYKLQKAAVTFEDGEERMITDWDPVY